MDISLSERIDFLTKERSEKRVSQEVQVLGGFAYLIDDILKNTGSNPFPSLQLVKWNNHYNLNSENKERFCLILNLDASDRCLSVIQLRRELSSAFFLNTSIITSKLYSYELDMSLIKEGTPIATFEHLKDLQDLNFLDMEGNQKMEKLSNYTSSSTMTALIRNGDQLYPLHCAIKYRHLFPENVVNGIQDAYESYLNLTNKLIEIEGNKTKTINCVDYYYEERYELEGQENNLPVNSFLAESSLSSCHLLLYNWSFLSNSGSDWSKGDNLDFFWSHINDVSDSDFRRSLLRFTEIALSETNPIYIDERKALLKKCWTYADKMNLDKEVLSKFIVGRSNPGSVELYSEWANEINSAIKKVPLRVELNENIWSIEVDLFHHLLDVGIKRKDFLRLGAEFLLRKDDINTSKSKHMMGEDINTLIDVWDRNLEFILDDILGPSSNGLFDNQFDFKVKSQVFDNTCDKFDVRLVLSFTDPGMVESKNAIFDARQIREVIDKATRLVISLSNSDNIRDFSYDISKVDSLDKNSMEKVYINNLRDSLVSEIGPLLSKRALEGHLNNMDNGDVPDDVPNAPIYKI